MWSIHNMEYCLTVKRSTDTVWMNYKNIVLSERSQSQKPRIYDSIYMKSPEGQTYGNIT